MQVYLDNSATTRCFDSVAETVKNIMLEDYGNPSSLHMKGYEAETLVRRAREDIAATLKANDREIIFTSGGTEADNMAIIGTAAAKRRQGRHIITLKIEHPAVLSTMEYLEKEGFEVTYLPVGKDGVVSTDTLKEAVREDTILVSVMHTNNEIGSVQPIGEIGAFLKKHHPGITFHVDAVQGYGKAVIHPKKLGIDLLSVSGHKIHGPKGIGFLYRDEKCRIVPINFGGGQQKGMRSGTENVPGICGMAVAAREIYARFEEERALLYELKKRLTGGILEIENTVINGPEAGSGAPHIVSAAFKGIRSEVLLHALEEKGIYVSAGSACASNKTAGKSVLGSDTMRAVTDDRSVLESTVRLSLSVFTTAEEIDYTVSTLKDIVPVLRKYRAK